VSRSTTPSTTRDRDDFDFQGTLEKEVSNPGVNNESKRVEVKETLVDATTEATTARVDEEITKNVSSILEKMKHSEIKVSAIEKNPRQPVASARNVSEVKEDVKAIRNNNFQRPRFSPLSSISRKAAPVTTSTVTSSIPSTTWGTTETSTILTSISTDPSLRTTSLEKYEEIVTNAVEMMEDVFLETLDNDHAKESRPVLRNVQPHFNRESLISKLRPLVAEVLSSSSTASLTLNEKVEKLREVLMEESPGTLRSNFKSSSFNFHARNLFLKLQDSARKMRKATQVLAVSEHPAGGRSEGEEERTVRTTVSTTSNPATSRGNSLSLSFTNLDKWKVDGGHGEASTPQSVMMETDVRERLDFVNVRQSLRWTSQPSPPAPSTTSPATSRTSTVTTTEVLRIRRVVFSSLNYPAIPTSWTNLD